MRLQDDPYLRTGADPALLRQLDALWRQAAGQVNALTEGRIAAITNAAPAPPVAGEFMQGDQVRNSAPVEAGIAGSMYVVHGWICIASGNPGTWVPMRALTGN